MVRIKHRYLLINVLYPEQPQQQSTQHLSAPKTRPSNLWTLDFRRPSPDLVDSKLILRIIRNNVAELFGDYGIGIISPGLRIVYLSSATSTSIVRCPRAGYRLVWAALSLSTQLPKPTSERCVFQVVRVSGTIRKAEEAAIRSARAVIFRSQQNGLEKSIQDCTRIKDSFEDNIDDFDDSGEDECSDAIN